MDETSRKRPLEDDDPSSTVSPSKRSRAPAPSGRAQRQSLSSSSSTDTTSTVSSRDSSEEESSSAEEDSDDESTSSEGTSSSSASSSPSSSSSSSSSSESEEGNERRIEDTQDNIDESDDSSDDEEEDASIINVRGRPKPRIQRINGDSSILSRISNFLPRLKAANDELRRNFEDGKSKDIVMDDVNEEDEGQYIEMNLGLGVLEGQDDEGSDESSARDDSDNTSDNEPGPSTGNVLDKLMGKKTKSKRPAIEEMED